MTLPLPRARAHKPGPLDGDRWRPRCTGQTTNRWRRSSTNRVAASNGAPSRDRDRDPSPTCPATRSSPSQPLRRDPRATNVAGAHGLTGRGPVGVACQRLPRRSAPTWPPPRSLLFSFYYYEYFARALARYHCAFFLMIMIYGDNKFIYGKYY